MTASPIAGPSITVAFSSQPGLGAAIRQARQASPLTISDIATALGISRQRLCQIEAGTDYPRLDLSQLETLERVLRCDFSQYVPELRRRRRVQRRRACQSRG